MLAAWLDAAGQHIMQVGVEGVVSGLDRLIQGICPHGMQGMYG